MATFWQLLKDSTIIQGIIALLVLGAFVGRLFQCGEVDPSLVGIAGTVVGFYFGSKVTRAAVNDKGKQGG